MGLSLIDQVKANIVRQGSRVLIGFPSDSQRKMKASGLHFSAEYYAKEAANIHRSVMHRLVAEACAKVLCDPEVHDLMLARFTEIVDEMERTNGLKVAEEIRADEKAQDEVEAKVKVSVAKVAKVIAKAKPKTVTKTVAKAPAKTTTKTRTVTKPKTTTKPVAKSRTTAKK